MSDGPRQEPSAAADKTRDIALPPLPDRPPPSMPEEWAALRPELSAVDSPTTAVPEGARPPLGPAAEPLGGVEKSQEVEEPDDRPAAEERRLARQRTDELVQAPDGAARERTLAFPSPEMRHRSIEPVRVGSTPRRWPWALLALLPVLIIVTCGIAWLILLRGV